MSDVAIAPSAPAPAAAPAPASTPATEVPVNTSPVSTPTPVGPQAPDKPPGEASSRRDSIQKAFAKARQDNPPKPREAKMGDNNPPEPTERINLKRRPDDQPKGDVPSRQRGEHGHFAPRAQTDATPASVTKPDATRSQPASIHPQLPADAPYREPLPRMDEHAKAAWAATPEPIRGAVHRMNQEFTRAYHRYKPDIDVMNTIRPFVEMAAQQGTTLERALNNYVQMEQKLRQDPLGGLDVIVHNLNLRADNGQKLTFADICYAYLSQSPEQQALLKGQNTSQAQAQQIGQLHSMVSTLATGIQRMQYQQQFTQTRSALDRYAEAHPRFDELGDLIEHEIKLGFSLDDAYRRAELLRPATHAAQTRSASAQTRPTGKSISGAPAGPLNGAGRPKAPVSRRDAIANAIKQASGSL